MAQLTGTVGLSVGDLEGVTDGLAVGLVVGSTGLFVGAFEGLADGPS